MSVDVRLPSGPAEVGEPPPRRFRRYLVGGTALILVGVVAGVLTWGLNYQPISSGFLSGVQAPQAEVKLVSNSYGDEYVVKRPQPGSTISLSFGLIVPPDARFAVTLDSVGSPFNLRGEQGMVGWVEQVSVHYRVNGRGPTQTLVNEPLQFEPGTALYMTIDLLVPDCPPSQSDGRYLADTVPVTYSAFGVPHEVALPLGYKVALEQAPQCPARG